MRPKNKTSANLLDDFLSERSTFLSKRTFELNVLFLCSAYVSGFEQCVNVS